MRTAYYSNQRRCPICEKRWNATAAEYAAHVWRHARDVGTMGSGDIAQLETGYELHPEQLKIAICADYGCRPAELAAAVRASGRDSELSQELHTGTYRRLAPALHLAHSDWRLADEALPHFPIAVEHAKQ